MLHISSLVTYPMKRLFCRSDALYSGLGCMSDTWVVCAGQMLYILPSVAAGHQIVVTWQLPCQAAFYEKKSDVYISNLLGHEGRGSLLAALQAKVSFRVEIQRLCLRMKIGCFSDVFESKLNVFRILSPCNHTFLVAQINSFRGDLTNIGR